MLAESLTLEVSRPASLRWMGTRLTGQGAIYCATKHAVASFSSSLMKELVNTPIRVCEIQPGMVETEFSVVRFRGDKSEADKVYEGLDPREYTLFHIKHQS